MDTLVLEAALRKKEQKAKSLRATGSIPAVYYGRGQGTLAVEVNHQKFKKIYDKAGENTIIELSVDGKKMPVLIYDVQYDPVFDNVYHVDFLHVDMTKEVTTTVKVHIVGTAPAVKNLAGVLDVLKHEIKIRCLPKDLIHSIDVDVSSIVDFNTTIHIKDLIFPSAIKVLDNAEDAVVTATPPRAEEETKPSEAAVPIEGAALPSDQAESGAAASSGATTAGAPVSAATRTKEQKK